MDISQQYPIYPMKLIIQSSFSDPYIKWLTLWIPLVIEHSY